MSSGHLSDGGQSELFEAPRPDGASADSAIPVSLLNHSTRRLLERSAPRLWIRGEVTNWRAHGSGHRYFRLRDEDAQVDCVMFQGDAWKLPTDPDEGMEVVVFGQPTLYEQRGQFQVVVRELEASGEGLWRIAFERLRAQLAEEGLLDPSRRRAIPTFPTRVAVVTSRDGAALHDVLTVLRRRSPWVDVTVVHCRVQGEDAAFDVRDALDQAQRLEGVDTIILARGGGSMEDLWAFNEEIAVRAVANCAVPVICAIGHEVDVTLCELVADLRAQTPSVAAEVAAPDLMEVRRRVASLSGGLARGLRRRVDRGRERLLAYQRVLPRVILGRVTRDRARIEALAGRLHALSPLDVLRRGYAVASSTDGEVLSHIDRFAVGDEFKLRVRGGEAVARTESTMRTEENGE